MNLLRLSLLSLCALSLSAAAQGDKVVLHQTDFNTGIPSDYAIYDLDGQTHHYTMVQEGLDQGLAWTTLRETGTSNYYAASTSKYKVAKGETAAPANDCMVSSRIRILAADAQITWRAQSLCTNINTGDCYEVRVSTSGNKPEDFTDAPVFSIEEETVNEWTERTASLGAYAGKDVYIAFVNRSLSKEILAIDDICVSSSHGNFYLTSEVDEHVFGTAPLQISARLHSNSSSPLTRFTACCKVANEELRREYTGLSLQPGEAFLFEFEKTFPLTPGDTLAYNLWVEIEGERPDTLKGYAVSFLFKPTRRTVIEEGTGMWCGYCPIGTVAMQRMKEKYPDAFIGIATHYEDILEVEGYARPLYFSAYPMGIVNRKYEAEPMVLAEVDGKEDYSLLHGGFETAFLKEQTEVALADVSLTATEENKRISVSAEARFAVNVEQADFRWVFVTVEDAVEGDGFYQTNYMSGKTQYDLDGYEDLPDRIIPYTFNDVALSIADHLYGFEGSLPASIEAGKSYTFDRQFTVSNIRNAANVRIVAMLLDGKTGHVVNATQQPLYPTGIDAPTTAAKAKRIAGYYSADGRRLAAPQKGINLVRYTDGSSQKILK